MIRGGRNNITSVPAFSNDAEKLLLCSANSVSVYSVATGLQISTLEGHTAPVTSVFVERWMSTKTLNDCWTASLDGKIRHWEFLGPTLVETFDTHLPIYSLVVSPNLRKPHQQILDIIAYVSVEDYSSESSDMFGQIRRFNLSEEPLPSGDIMKEMKEPKSFIISPSGEFFGVCNNCEIHMWNASFGASRQEMTLHHTELITVFAFHPNQTILAAGDVTGRVLIWKGIDMEVRSEDDVESYATLYSHSTEVNVLTFSSDGAYLYSGDKEGVLVAWQLDTGKKQILPRKESPLLYFIFSVDPTLSSMICADNLIHLLKMPSMEIVRTISGIKPPTSDPVFVSYGRLIRTVSIDRFSGIAAFSTADHRVQLYNLLHDHEISEIQVCERNHHPDDDKVRVVVTAVALSRNGSVMATAEARFATGNISGAAITAIALNPARSMAVSISSAVDFKIWVCNSDKNLTPEDSNWIYLGGSSYKQEPITAAVFSGDGSRLAVAATVITVFDPLKIELLSVVGKANAPIMELSFAGDFLVAASHCSSTPKLYVRNLKMLCFSWSYSLHIEAIATEVDSSYFAVLTWLPESDRLSKLEKRVFHGKDGAILLFDGSSGPKPVAFWTVMKARGGTLSFVEDRLLAYVNGSHEYVLFDPYSDEKLETSAIDYEVLLAAISKKKESSRKKALMLERPWETLFCGSTLHFPHKVKRQLESHSS